MSRSYGKPDKPQSLSHIYPQVQQHPFSKRQHVTSFMTLYLHGGEGPLCSALKLRNYVKLQNQ